MWVSFLDSGCQIMSGSTNFIFQQQTVLILHIYRSFCSLQKKKEQESHNKNTNRCTVTDLILHCPMEFKFLSDPNLHCSSVLFRNFSDGPQNGSVEVKSFLAQHKLKTKYMQYYVHHRTCSSQNKSQKMFWETELKCCLRKLFHRLW